jgi:hypothetical protein
MNNVMVRRSQKYQKQFQGIRQANGGGAEAPPPSWLA